MTEDTQAVRSEANWRQRFWGGLPEVFQVVFVICACVLAFAAAFAPLVYLLRRVGVG